jgi:hypothetical protein
VRAVVQRVSQGEVTIDGRAVGRIGRGFVVLLGVAEGDTEQDAAFPADTDLGWPALFRQGRTGLTNETRREESPVSARREVDDVVFQHQRIADLFYRPFRRNELEMVVL